METISEMTVTVLDRALAVGDAGRVTGERQGIWLSAGLGS
jgi:hypothetical protein